MPLGLALIRRFKKRMGEAGNAPESEYKSGYMDGVKDAIEELEDELWERGEDVE